MPLLDWYVVIALAVDVWLILYALWLHSKRSSK